MVRYGNNLTAPGASTGRSVRFADNWTTGKSVGGPFARLTDKQG
jgi:hypothetical protein